MTRIVVVCEGDTDLPLVCDLADRVLHDAVDWLRDFDTLDDLRSYGGIKADQAYLMWSKVPALFQAARLQRSRGFGKTTPPPDYVATRKLLLLIADHHQAKRGDGGVHGVLIFRDADREPERRQGIRAAHEDFVASDGASGSAHPWGQHVAIAVAEPKNEAWVLAGFVPANDAEAAELETARKELGFAPNECPERLHASEHGAKRSAKDVLGQLCPDHERRSQCWRDTPLEILRLRGERCGLAQFLDEVRQRLAPLFGASARPA